MPGRQEPPADKSLTVSVQPEQQPDDRRNDHGRNNARPELAFQQWKTQTLYQPLNRDSQQNESSRSWQYVWNPGRPYIPAAQPSDGAAEKPVHRDDEPVQD